MRKIGRPGGAGGALPTMAIHGVDWERKGHALRASRFLIGGDVHSPDPFIARRFEPPGNAWARSAT